MPRPSVFLPLFTQRPSLVFSANFACSAFSEVRIAPVGPQQCGATWAGPLAKLDVVGLLHAMLERQAGEGFFRRVAAEPRPLLFCDPESGFYPRFPLRCV